MKFFGKASTILAMLLYVGLGACTTETEDFLAQHPDIQVGREALEKAEASFGPDTFSVVNKPLDNIVLYQEFDADTNERISAVALINDEKAEEYYNEYNMDGDIKGKVMKRYDPTGKDADKCGLAISEAEPGALFAREEDAPRCGQFCSRGPSCTGDRRCRACRYVGGRCRRQLSCQRR